MRDTLFWTHVQKSPGCWLWTGSRDKKGYGRLCRGIGIHHRAHRYAWEQTYGLIPPGLLVCHSCDTPSCVRPDHLYLGTNATNIRDGYRRGRVKIPDNRGERNGQATLTTADVQEIRRLYATGRYSQSALGRRFSIAQGAISMIVNRRMWAHV